MKVIFVYFCITLVLYRQIQMFSSLAGEFKLLRTFLPDFFAHHKMRVVKLRKLVWRLMATEEEQEHQVRETDPK